MLNVFSDDAFGLVPLTDAINNLKFIPGRIGQMGLFRASSVSTSAVSIEMKDGLLSIIAPTPRGGPGHTLDKNNRTLRSVLVPHFEINDSVMAEEVQGVRAWGSETETETVMGKITERLALHADSMAITEESARIGAIKGIVTYGDNSTLDLFDLFGVDQLAEVDFDLDNANPASGALRKKIAGVVRSMAAELGGSPLSGVYALCGDAFYDDLIAHPEVRETYLGWTAAQDLRGGYAYGAFPFGGITWENYRGTLPIDDSAMINTDKCHIFPVGVPNLFRTYYAPADYNETVNTMGQRLYSKQLEMPNDKGWSLDTQMNALNIATRPRVLIQGKRT